MGLLLSASGSAGRVQVSWIEISPTVVGLISRRALYLNNGVLTEVPNSSSGLKPIVLLDGVIKERATTEGIPIIIVMGILRTLDPNTETLLI